jgi:DNA-binding MarR family transcriptional regulator
MTANKRCTPGDALAPMKTGRGHRIRHVAQEISSGHAMLDMRNSCLRFLRYLDERAGREGLTSTQWMILDVLCKAGPCSVRTLSTHLAHDAGAMTRVLDSLESKELIERRRCVADRRILFVTISASGKVVVARLATAVG